MSDSTLKELWQQVAEKKNCEAKQKELTAQRDTLADRLKKLEKSKLAEQADVDRLEGHSLAAFFYQVIGKMDEKLDKERQEAYLALAQRTANGLTRYWESWTDYLTTASRLYKYPFADQLMIYAQRPDATACADYDIWNNRMNRYVRRGSKGIALLDESSGFPRLHYVFDVSDTGVRRNSRDPDLWQYNDDLKQPVSEIGSFSFPQNTIFPIWVLSVNC